MAFTRATIVQIAFNFALESSLLSYVEYTIHTTVYQIKEVLKFSAFGFSPKLLEGLEAIGFDTPTPVQVQAIPPILQGKDVITCAQTGTGKTAAYLLPVLHHNIQKPNNGIDTLILCPTRELAIQVDQQIEVLSYFTSISSIAIYGGRDGSSMEQEKRALKTGADIIVATPGRLKAHIQMGYVDFSTVRHFVLDEADRMLDMGFVDDIVQIMHQLPKKRQNLLFSATMPQRIRKFATSFMNQPEEINIAIAKPAEGIIQVAYLVKDVYKTQFILELLKGKQQANKRIIIFAGTKKNVRSLASALTQQGFRAAAVSSDLEQSQREAVLLDFRNLKSPIVVATDVLSRGIDIQGIDLVINFDVPSDAEDYVHRIGRTARAKSSGMAITLVDPQSWRKMMQIEVLMGMEVKKLRPAINEWGFDPTHMHTRSNRNNHKRRRSNRSKHQGNRRKNTSKRKKQHNSDHRPGVK